VSRCRSRFAARHRAYVVDYSAATAAANTQLRNSRPTVTRGRNFLSPEENLVWLKPTAVRICSSRRFFVDDTKPNFYAKIGPDRVA